MELKNKILVVEDNTGICKFLKMTLESASYDVICAYNARSALEIAASHCPECVLLDLGLPDMDGLDVISSIRKWSKMPIIVISARTLETEKAAALDAGADDYLTKPFGTIELLARIRTAMRHTLAASQNDGIALNGIYTTGDMKIDYNKHKVYMNGSDSGLTPTEFRIVAMLGKHAGQVVTYKALLSELWGPGAWDNKILRVHMASIRKKLEPDPDEPMYIFTETGVGYRMRDDEQ